MQSRYPEKGPNYPFLKAWILSSEEKGFIVDDYGTIDSNPDRIAYRVEAIGCDLDDFLDCFLATERGHAFCKSGNSLIDVGGTSLDLSPGTLLDISFNEWINWKVYRAKREINKLVVQAFNNVKRDR